MNELQRQILMGYLRKNDLDILSINFLKGGNISKDSLVVHYYKQEKQKWLLVTDQVAPGGEITGKSIEVYR